MTSTNPILPLCICGEPFCKIPYGFCHCGCGKKTTISSETRLARRISKGLPHKYIKAHQGRHPRIDFSDSKPFKIEGIYCKLISLTRGYFVIVGESDYQFLTQWEWEVWIGKNGHVYAVRTDEIEGKRRIILMHREILGLKHGDTRKVDHESGCGLDNRRDNIRVATSAENNRNAKRSITNSTGFKGVQKYFRRFRAFITVDGKRIWLGSFPTAEEAHEAYKAAAVKYFGKFARFA